METLIATKVWVRVKMVQGKAFMAFRSELKDRKCPNCQSNFELKDLKGLITQPDNEGEIQSVGWNIECSNCQARLEIFNDVRDQ